MRYTERYNVFAVIRRSIAEQARSLAHTRANEDHHRTAAISHHVQCGRPATAVHGFVPDVFRSGASAQCSRSLSRNTMRSCG